MSDWIWPSALAIWMFLACCFPISDFDFWWHLKTGELILDEGKLPDLDWYTFTDADKPWVDLHWGFQVLITLIWRLGGSNLFVLVKAGVYTAALLLGWSIIRQLPVALKTLLWIAPAIALSGRAYDRPEMLSLLFLAAWLWICERLHDRPRLIWLLAPLQVIWTNCHALSVLGLVTAACYLAEWLVRLALRPAAGTNALNSETQLGLPAMSPRERDAGSMVFAFGLVFLAALVNPWLDEGAFFPLELYKKFSVDTAFWSTNIGEFQRPLDFFRRHGFINLYLNVEVGLLITTGLSFIVLLVCRRRWSLMRLLMFAGFTHLAFAASRNSSLFALVATWALSANVRDLLHESTGAVPGVPPSIRRIRENVQAVSTIVAGALLALMILAVTTGLWPRITNDYLNQFDADNVQQRRYKTLGLGERPRWFMHAAAKFAGQPGFPDHALVFTNGQAAVYVYHNGPTRKVFMDARLEVSTKRTFERYLAIEQRILQGDRSWAASLRDAQGREPVVLIDRGLMLAWIHALGNTPGWRLVYLDDVAGVFLETRLAERLKLDEVKLPPLPPQ